MSEWISVKDRLPDIREDVLFTDGEYLFMGYWDEIIEQGKVWFTSTSWPVQNVTHWIPFPEQPSTLDQDGR